MDAKRRVAHIKEAMEGHFKEFKRCKEKWGILHEDLYNFDETGCLIGMVASSLVIALADCNTIYVDDPANRELLASVECISAGRYYVPPMVIFKGAFHLRKSFKNDMDDNILSHDQRLALQTTG
jgi:hypothetical protein